MPEIEAPGNIDNTKRDDGNAEDKPYEKARAKLDFQETLWFYRVRISFLLSASVATFGVVLIYVLNLVLPEHWRWLNEQDMSLLKDLSISIVVGLLMSATTAYFFRRKE